MEQPNQSNKVLIGLVVVVLLAITTTTVVMVSSHGAAEPSQPAGQAASSSAVTQTSHSSYKDGTYSATGSYQTPGGTESIDVKITLKDSVVSDADVTQRAISDEAHDYQAAFVSGYKTQVVGKNINDVSLNRVAGSSLTPGGFNRALETIKSEAAA